jgi:hypothetical protein
MKASAMAIKRMAARCASEPVFRGRLVVWNPHRR